MEIYFHCQLCYLLERVLSFDKYILWLRYPDRKDAKKSIISPYNFQQEILAKFEEKNLILFRVKFVFLVCGKTPQPSKLKV